MKTSIPMFFKSHLLSRLFFLLSIFMLSCNSDGADYVVSTSNPSDLVRISETIEIALSDIKDISESAFEDLVICDGQDKEVLSQLIDMNQDSIYDHIIFQTDFEPNEAKTFTLAIGETSAQKEKPTLHTFCRIIPERIDDFAWENDKVAFRTYGPECQRMFEEGIPGGLISSGIDAWTKRVDYPVINKWYKADQDGISYHEDHGEGLDAYHVGTTRGCGGTAILIDSTYVLSENFTNWNVLANGPIRSVFELIYAPIEASEQSVREKKRITLDLGSNLYLSEVSYNAKSPVRFAAVGLALHEGKGTTNQNLKEGWVSYWEPYDDSELGTAILVNPEILDGIKVKDTLSDDESFNNVWANVEVKNNTFDYWAGFGWKKSADFDSREEWEEYLKKEYLKKKLPIEVKITKN